MPDLVNEALAAAKPTALQQQLTLDTLVEIFSLTLGSLKGAGGMVVWCWVNYSQMSLQLNEQGRSTLVFAAWLVVVVVVRALARINEAFVSEFGCADFSLDPKSDEIVITGGSSGLGLLLAALFSAQNFNVHSLDVSEPALQLAHTYFHNCDVGSPKAVNAVVDEINSVKSTDSSPSGKFVLINCAGTLANTLGPLENVPPANIQAVLNTNVLGSILVTQAFLRHPNALKMVVSIGSATALCGPAFAGVYAGSKAAVRTFFESLRHELRPGVRVLSVTLGQLDTRMFADVDTPSRFLSPVASSADVATSICNAVLNGRQGEISMPCYTALLPYAALLPQSIVDIMRRIVGVDEAARR